MKYERLEIRLHKKEKDHLSSIAEKNGLSISEYIRIKLLEEDIEKPSVYKRDMTTFNVLGYYLLGKMAKNQLSEEEITDAKKKTKKTLAGYNMNE